MAMKDGNRNWVMVNRAPVLTLWAAIAADVLGFEHEKGNVVENMHFSICTKSEAL